MEYKRHLITSALPYANGPVHIGHLAGSFLPADIYVRLLRAKKEDALYICGTDEHGVPISIRAMKEGVTPQEVVDKYYQTISESLNQMGISFDIFSRTSKAIHHETSQAFFLELYKKGIFEEKETEQFYDEEKQTFLADRYITGTCPNCSHPSAYGDQCEKCGTSLSPEELINPKSTLSNSIPIRKKTKHWYLPLQNYETWLRQWILEEHSDWKNNVYGQCKSWLDNGLHPRAMTRDSNWGVPVPLPNAEGKVLYVWFDAPIGYISATKELTANWSDYWCKEDTKLVHFLGKDNIVFHCIIFPAMLKAHGGFVLPNNVPANEFLNIEGEKVSTSRNWAVWLHDYIQDFPDMQDAMRYTLCTNMPESKDNDFTWKDFQDRNNNELVAILGNFVNRTFVLMHKLCNGKVPPYHIHIKDETDDLLFDKIVKTKSTIDTSITNFRFREGIFSVIELAREGNRYLQEKEPWKKADNQAAIDNCIHLCLQLCANLAIYMNPFLPFTAKKLCKMMKVVDRILDWENGANLKLLKTGYSLNAPELLFKKIEDETILAQIEKLKNGVITSNTPQEKTSGEPSNNITPIKPIITFEDFDKIDLRVATITHAEKVEKADKLLKLTLDLGFETRTVLSGIALHYQPEQIIGKQVTLVANLAPRKMRGIESNGMILMTNDHDGKLLFVNTTLLAQNGELVK
ncbi:MAG TPA: methionine--tRNA ligase [Chitinophagaceae bacterium]|nr:MAG: methionyl-tRNA synthetase [Bacteroidetes bacterium OLB11]HMN33553.1 methionine--tRNA ligase [Chitinophagaceae bacterium]